jgi:hypothetical protein
MCIALLLGSAFATSSNAMDAIIDVETRMQARINKFVTQERGLWNKIRDHFSKDVPNTMCLPIKLITNDDYAIRLILPISYFEDRCSTIDRYIKCYDRVVTYLLTLPHVSNQKRIETLMMMMGEKQIEIQHDTEVSNITECRHIRLLPGHHINELLLPKAYLVLMQTGHCYIDV